MKKILLAIVTIGFKARRAVAVRHCCLLLAGLGLLGLTFHASGTELISCDSGSGGNDNTYRGFYVPQYPGVTLDSARLQLSALSTGTYTVSLTVFSNSYDGVILGSATNTVSFPNLTTAQNQFVTFNYPSLPTVKNGRICFIITVSGPQTLLRYSVHPSFTGGCPEVVETEDTIPPLDTPRRNGVNLVLTGQAFPQGTLISCSGTPGDFYYHGFYISQYPGVTLDSATLKISASVAGIYEISMTVLSNAYNGTVLAIETNKVVLTASSSTAVPVTWLFPSTPIQKYGRVCFKLAIVSGPSTSVFYAVPDDNGCNEVIETEGTTPPLDTVRRQGVDLVIVGENDPATDLHLNIVQQSSALYLKWNSIGGRTYTIVTNLNLQPFTALQTGIAATPPTNTVGPLSLTPAGRQFYRVSQSPAP